MFLFRPRFFRRLLLLPLRTGCEIILFGIPGPGVTRLGRTILRLRRASGKVKKRLLVAILYTKLYAFACKRRRARRAAAVAVLRAFDNADVRMLFESYGVPSWAMMKFDYQFSSTEKVAWLNSLLHSLWPHISRCIQSVLREVVQPLLDNVSRVFDLRIQTFTLGNLAPVLDSIEVLNDDDDSLRVAVSVKWAGDPNIVFKVSGAGVVGVAIEIVNLVVQGNMEITLKPLIDRVPLIGGVSLMFNSDPYVRYDVRVKAAPGVAPIRLEAIPGLNPLVLHLLGSLIRDAMVFPRNIVIPIVGGDDETHNEYTKEKILEELSYKKIGSLSIIIKRARNLINTDIGGLSDPYVRIASMPASKNEPSYLSRKRATYITKIVKNNLNPVWLEDCMIDVYDFQKEVLAIRIYDSDLASKDDLLGQLDIPMNIICTEDSKRQYEEDWFKLFGPPNVYNSSFGDIQIAYKWKPTCEFESNNRKDSLSLYINKKQQGNEFLVDIREKHEVSGFTRGVEHLIEKLVHYKNSGNEKAYISNLRSLLRHVPNGSTPIWTTDPLIERGAFINKILLRLWPSLNGLIKDEIDIIVASGVLKKFFPLEFDVSHFELGKLPPIIDGIKFIKFSKTSISLDLYVCFAGDLRCELGVGVVVPLPFLRKFRSPFSRLSVSIDQAQLIARIRVNIAPLLPIVPIVGGVTVQFMQIENVSFGSTILSSLLSLCQPGHESPTQRNWVDASVKIKLSPVIPFNIDIFNLPVLKPIILSILNKLTATLMQFPKSLPLPILDIDHPSVTKHLESSVDSYSGKLTVGVHKASELPNTDGRSLTDAYAVLVVENLSKRKLKSISTYGSRMKRTSVVFNCLDPDWTDGHTSTAMLKCESKILCTSVEDVVVVVCLFDHDFKGSRITAKNMEKQKAKHSNLDKLDAGRDRNRDKRKFVPLISRLRSKIPKSIEHCQALDQRTETSILDIQWSDPMKKMIAMIVKYIEVRNAGILALTKDSDSASPKRAESLSISDDEKIEDLESIQSNGIASRESKEVVESATSIGNSNDLHLSNGHTSASGMDRSEQSNEELSQTEVMSEMSTTIDEMLTVECGYKGNNFIGAIVLDGGQIKTLLESSDKENKSNSYHWIDVEGTEASKVNISIDWTDLQTQDKIEEEENTGRISRSKTLTSIANQKAIGLKRCTGFLVVDVLHASNLSLPKRRPKLRDPRLLKPFIQIRFAGETRNSRPSKSASPNFDEVLQFEDVKAATGDYIDVSVHHMISKPSSKKLRCSRVGYVRVSFGDVLKAVSGLKATWTLLDCQSGSVSLNFTWFPFVNKTTHF